MGRRDDKIDEQDQYGRTALHKAVLSGRADRIAAVLQSRPRPNKNLQDFKKQSALHLAASQGNHEAVHLLLQPFQANTNLTDQNLQTPLHYAARDGHIGIVKQLLKRGANPNATDKYRQTPLHIAAGCGKAVTGKLLLKKAKSGLASQIQAHLGPVAHDRFHEIASELLAKGATIDALDGDRRTPLHLAAAIGCDKVVGLLLSKDLESKDSKDKFGQPPLYYAALRGHKLATELLRQAGANTEMMNGDGQTLLYQFASIGDENAVMLLLSGKNKANVDAQDIDLNPPIYAAAKGNHAFVMQILDGNGADKTARNEAGETVLHRLAREGCQHGVDLLLKFAADREALDGMHQTPLYLAARSDRKEVVRRLLMEERAVLDARDDTGGTLLHRAAREGHLEAVDLLAGEGANLELVDDEGKTPLYIAAELNHKDIAKLLYSKYGAKALIGPDEGRLILHRTVSENNRNAIRLLLAVGVGRNAQDRNGQTALHTAPNNARNAVAALLAYETSLNIADNIGQTPLHVFAARGDDALPLIDLLLNHRANTVTKDINGQTPLHAAAKAGAKTVARLLQDPVVKAELNTADNSGKTPLHEAAQHGKQDVARLLCENGAAIDIQDHEGQTPLHIAAKCGRTDIIRLFRDLPSWDAAKTVTNENGEMPLHLVCLSGNNAAVGVFLDNNLESPVSLIALLLLS
ncbi:hypothetical protein Dda_7780 [Drechslerella dactyloides]|uniref:Ankyrin n=1 Tax=Drechslerella dactyloides TaxID=74499 RepID=A0AAD6NG57_DREDA|nr:hypothetical protein Dda_7780 [Drechslerella dactyloides]